MSALLTITLVEEFQDGQFRSSPMSDKPITVNYSINETCHVPKCCHLFLKYLLHTNLRCLFAITISIIHEYIIKLCSPQHLHQNITTWFIMF